MSDATDDAIFNQWAATTWLIEAAKDWERLALDQSVGHEARVKAALYARAIRTEIRP